VPQSARAVRRLGCLLVVASATSLANVSLARASFALVQPFYPSGNALSVTAALGEVNDIGVFEGNGVYVVTDGAGVTAGANCEQVSAQRVDCALASAVFVSADDQDDRVEVGVAPPETPGAFLPPVQVRGGNGDDVLTTGPGRDDVDGEDGADVLETGAGDDQVHGGCCGSVNPDADSLDAGPGNDLVYGDADNDRVAGGAGKDFIGGDAGDDTILGGDGDDTIYGGPGADVEQGGPGADDFDWEPGFPQEAYYSVGSDTLDGGDGDDTFHGELDYAHSVDGFHGGDGLDGVEYSARTSSLSVSLDGHANDGAADEGDNVSADVEQVTTGSGNDTIVGSDAANALDGRDGDDQLDGGAGSDTLDGGAAASGSDTLLGGPDADVLSGGAGDDSLDGGAGDDKLDGVGGSDGLEGGDGNDSIYGGAGLDTLAGGPGDDTLDGAAPALVGADGADNLAGGDGNDDLSGGSSNDFMDGGAGADRLRGQQGRDTVSYDSSDAPITVTLDDQTNDGAPGEGDNVASDVEIILGGGDEDTLSGNAATNTLDGGSGEDFIDGGTGFDNLLGATGSDTLRARDGVPDRVSCGGEVDFAIVDASDSARDCEYVDDGLPKPPVLGGDVIIQRANGSLSWRLPDAERFVPLLDRLHVPIGTAVDSTNGVVRVTAAKGRRGARQTAAFYGGRFTLHQRRARRASAVIRLVGGDFSQCARSGTALAAKRRTRRIRRLWGSESRHGRFRARGRWSTGTVRGTVWLTEDRCDGTLTRVRRGTVIVRDRVRHRTVRVRAGHAYLARAPTARRRAPRGPR
jgi:Ca2+-binding RTX toxin-like protein